MGVSLRARFGTCPCVAVVVCLLLKAQKGCYFDSGQEKMLVPYPDSDDSVEEVASFGPAVQGGGDSERWSGRFKKPATAEVMSSLSRKTFAASTDRKIEWAVNLYRQWRFSRLSACGPERHIQDADIVGLNLSKESLCYAMCAFVSEIKRQDGQEFGGKGLYNLVILIQFHLEKRGMMWCLLDDDEFVKLKFTVDNLMKMRCADRVSVAKSASPISLADEDIMWEKGILGEDTPVKLRNTMLYLLGLMCALRGGRNRELCVVLLLILS